MSGLTTYMRRAAKLGWIDRKLKEIDAKRLVLDYEQYELILERDKLTRLKLV